MDSDIATFVPDPLSTAQARARAFGLFQATHVVSELNKNEQKTLNT
jgi:hypothetical protein